MSNMPRKRIPSDVSEEANVPRPPIHFTSQSHSLLRILQQYALPIVVRCDVASLPTSPIVPAGFDISEPLLLFKKQSVRKAIALSLSFSKILKEYITVGNDLRIPEDYKGYFGVIGSPMKCRKEDVPIPHYRQVSTLATSGCSTFLVGGEKPVTALLLNKGMAKTVYPQHYKLCPGEEMRMVRSWECTYTVIYPSTKIFKHRRKKKEVTQRFLLCYDTTDREFFLPYDSKGVFYSVGYKKDKPVQYPVMRMKDIIERYKFPLIVKLLVGSVPKTPCSFTGTLLLIDSGVDKTVAVSTIFEHRRNIKLEVPLNNELFFFVAHDTNELRTSIAYTRAWEACTVEADKCMRNIKVISRPSESDHKGSKKESKEECSEDGGKNNHYSCIMESSDNSGTLPGLDTSTLSERMSNKGSGSSVSSVSESQTVNRRNKTASGERKGLAGQRASKVTRDSVWTDPSSLICIDNHEHSEFVPHSCKAQPYPEVTESTDDSTIISPQMRISSVKRYDEFTFTDPVPETIAINQAPITTKTGEIGTATETHEYEDDESIDDYGKLWDSCRWGIEGAQATATSSKQPSNNFDVATPAFDGASPSISPKSQDENQKFKKKRPPPLPIKPSLHRAESESCLDTSVKANNDNRRRSSLKDASSMRVDSNRETVKCSYSNVPVASMKQGDLNEEVYVFPSDPIEPSGSSAQTAVSSEPNADPQNTYQVANSVCECHSVVDVDANVCSVMRKNLESSTRKNNSDSGVYMSDTCEELIETEKSGKECERSNDEFIDQLKLAILNGHIEKKSNCFTTSTTECVSGSNILPPNSPSTVQIGECELSFSGDTSASSDCVRPLKHSSTKATFASDDVLDTEEIIKGLKQAGIKEKTVSALRGCNHEKTVQLLEKDIEVEELKALLPEVGTTDLNKISMYLKGWKGS